MASSRSGETRFAPAARDDELTVDALRQAVERIDGVVPLLDALPSLVAVLSESRQIIGANRSLVDALGDGDIGRVLGLRPGELVDCQHASEMAAGCGTSDACRTCGAVAAILASQQGREETRECQIAQRSGNALDLRVRASPFSCGNRRFTILSVQDMADENRRRVLERTFFHDILNAAGGVHGIANVLADGASAEVLAEFSPLLTLAAEQLVEEIHAQRDLLAAERGELVIRCEATGSRSAIEEVARLYNRHPAGDGKYVEVASDLVELELETARPLLIRALSNMVKNALEASDQGERVRIGSRIAAEGVEFWVWNPAVMRREVQLQLFKRSFSTKGSGRGVGTYSMRLLVERYLGGKVDFESRDGEGTTFRITLPRGGPERNAARTVGDLGRTRSS